MLKIGTFGLHVAPGCNLACARRSRYSNHGG
jgi:hypothetical protein